MTESGSPGGQEIPVVRERLLAAALELFTSRGYAATTVREIVEAAGVTKPVLYYYFRNKEGIYLALMEEAYAIFERRVTEITGVSGTVRQRLHHFCLGLFDAVVEHLPMVRLIYSIYFGTPQGAPYYDLDKMHDRMLAVVDSLVSVGIATNELRPHPVRAVTWVVISTLNTAMEEQLCRLAPRLDRAGLAGMLDLVFDGIARSDP
jgi:TetR/AcrR family transcriptional regulator